jgi:cell division ATPase FtsA
MSVMAVLNQALDLVGVEARRYLYGIQSMAEFVFKGPAAKGASYSYNTSSPSSEQTQTQHSLLVDVGGCCIDLAILERSRIVKSLTLDWGSMHIASDIAKEVRCPIEQAVTISLEGQSSPRAIVKQVLEDRMNMLHNGVHKFMEGETLPDSLFITGRGALIDGVAESIGNLMELKPVICKSLLSSRFSDLSNQIAISNAIGSLEIAFSNEKPSRPWPSGLVDGVIERTKTILIDYF